jgi:hypothetical protein
MCQSCSRWGHEAVFSQNSQTGSLTDTSNSSHQDRTPSMTICSPPATQRGVRQLKKPMSAQGQLEGTGMITMQQILRGWRWLCMRRSACAYSHSQQNLEQLTSQLLICGATPPIGVAGDRRRGGRAHLPHADGAAFGLATIVDYSRAC